MQGQMVLSVISEAQIKQSVSVITANYWNLSCRNCRLDGNSTFRCSYLSVDQRIYFVYGYYLYQIQSILKMARYLEERLQSRLDKDREKSGVTIEPIESTPGTSVQTVVTMEDRDPRTAKFGGNRGGARPFQAPQDGPIDAVCSVWPRGSLPVMITKKRLSTLKKNIANCKDRTALREPLYDKRWWDQ